MPLCLLGGLAIATPAGAPVSLPTRKTALVLAALALAGEKGATREALAEWIWPDRSEGQGKSSLRQALTAIRKALPAVLEEAALESEQDRDGKRCRTGKGGSVRVRPDGHGTIKKKKRKNKK